MASVGRHTGSCEWAKRHLCECAGCGGSRHGWTGGVKLAQSGQAAERASRQSEVDHDWTTYYKPRRTPSLRVRACGIDSARLDLVKWMARCWPIRVADENRPGATEDYATIRNIVIEAGRSVGQNDQDIFDAVVAKGVDVLGHAIAKPTVNVIDAAVAPARRRDARLQLADHFSCDLFVALAKGVEGFQNTLEEVPGRVTDLILRSSNQRRRPLITREIVEVAVKKAWDPVQQAIEGALHTEEVLRSLRILAVLACPAPDKHRDVRQSGLKPLETEMLTSATKARLQSVFPQEFSSGL